MHIALSVPHAEWSPHRSGYEYAHQSWRPEEYSWGRGVAVVLKAHLEKAGHHVDLVEKSERYKCLAQCIPNVKTCGRYNAALVDATRRCVPADLAIEFHLNNGAPGANGALCLCSDSDRAELWARKWLTEWGACSQIKSIGVWRGDEAERLFGGKWWLRHGCKHAVIVEAGYASSATDSAYLLVPQSWRACVEAGLRAFESVEQNEGKQ